MAEPIKLPVLQWNQLTLDAIRCTKTSPPLAARALAMVHTAMYDAWSVYNECANSTSTATYIKVLDHKNCTADNRRKACSYAAYRVLMDLFWLVLPSESKGVFRDFMCEMGYDPDDTSLDLTKPQGIGNLMARLLIECRHGDGSNQLGTLHAPPWSDYAGYLPVNPPGELLDLNYWQPIRTESEEGTTVAQSFLLPHWGLTKPFALEYQWQFRPGKPFTRNQPEFKEQVREVIEYSARLTDEKKAIAEYWADGPGTYTPPGHWCEIAQFVAGKKRYGNSQCIQLFFALSNALLDASIACWDCKHHFDYVRPVTAVREIYKSQEIEAWGGPRQGPGVIKGANWQSYIPTPPFPEYVSGHSTFSSAAATILRCFTGSDEFEGCTTIEKGSSGIEPGMTPEKAIVLDWPTFTFAAQQAGESRLFGGIHFRMGNVEGQQLGVKVGQCVWEKASFYFNN